eukprot:Rmarinus@m.23841
MGNACRIYEEPIQPDTSRDSEESEAKSVKATRTDDSRTPPPIDGSKEKSTPKKKSKSPKKGQQKMAFVSGGEDTTVVAKPDEVTAIESFSPDIDELNGPKSVKGGKQNGTHSPPPGKGKNKGKRATKVTEEVPSSPERCDSKRSVHSHSSAEPLPPVNNSGNNCFGDLVMDDLDEISL